MKNDKKKNDEKVSFIFLKSLGKTTAPGKYKYKINQVENFVKIILNEFQVHEYFA